jgi:Iron/zinc purple acid phosphatase-like protein C
MVNHNNNPWTANVIFQTYGYGRVTIKNATTLHCEFIRAGYEPNDPSAGTVLDDVWIVRNER